MHPRVWNINKCGIIQCVSLTSNRLEEALKVIRNGFLKYENISKAIGLSENPEAIQELNELVITAAVDGVSLIAEEKSTGKIVGCILNKIHAKDSKLFYEEFNCQHELARSYVEIIAVLNNVADVFNRFQTNCYFESMFIGILPEYRGEGVATDLHVSTVKIIQHLVNGENVKIPLDGKPLSLHPAATLAVGYPTTFIMEKVLEKLGYTVGPAIDIGEHLKDTPVPPSIIPKLKPVKLFYRYCKKN